MLVPADRDIADEAYQLIRAAGYEVVDQKQLEAIAAWLLRHSHAIDRR